MATSIGKQNQDGGQKGSEKANEGMDPKRNTPKMSDDFNPDIPDEVQQNVLAEKGKTRSEEIDNDLDEPEIDENDDAEILLPDEEDGEESPQGNEDGH